MPGGKNTPAVLNRKDTPTLLDGNDPAAVLDMKYVTAVLDEKDTTSVLSGRGTETHRDEDVWIKPSGNRKNSLIRCCGLANDIQACLKPSFWLKGRLP